MPEDPHRPTTAAANRDVDAKDTGEQHHPGRARRGSITELSLKQGCGREELDVSARDKPRELLGLNRRFVSARHHRRAQCVEGRQGAVTVNHDVVGLHGSELDSRLRCPAMQANSPTRGATA